MDTDEIERRAYERYEEGDPRGGQFAPANKSGMIGSYDTTRLTYKGTYQRPAGKAKDQPTAPRSSSKFKTLAPDEDNDPAAVAEMQQLLTALGLGNLSSGVYDEDTENAVKAVQARLGIKKPNGRANKALINKMLNAFDLSPCIKRSDDPDGDEVERGRPYPGQKYRHGWISMSPVALLPADAVDDEYGEELDSADFGEASRIVAREHGVTIESEQGDDIAIHAAPSLTDAERWADLIDSGETYSRQRFGHEPYDGGASIRFGDLETDVDDPDEVAQALRDMAYTVEDHQSPPDDDIDEEIDGDETPIPDDPAYRAALLEVQDIVTRARRPRPGQKYRHGWIPIGAADLLDMSDDELLDHFHQISQRDKPDETALRGIYAELERRETGPDITSTDRSIDQLVASGRDFVSAYAEVHDLDEDRLRRDQLAAAVDRQPGETRDQAVRRAYAEATELAFLQAESWTNGHMLSPAGRAAGIDPRTLFSGTRVRARKYASEELARFWAEVLPRRTYTEFRAEALGRSSDRALVAAGQSAGNGRDFGL